MLSKSFYITSFIFLIIMTIIYYTKPTIFYIPKGNITINKIKKNKNYLLLPTISLVFAILIYLLLLNIESSKKNTYNANFHTRPWYYNL